ncbi:MAG: response regulator [candidate division NC10 bacterium]|nr:response regulator [candidate division NC10 bacterium]
MRMPVIVCSNNSVVVDAVSRAFDHNGHRLTVCESGLEVLGAVGVVASDLVILDLETPGLSGLLLVSAVKELAPGLPIVAVSTKPDPDARAVSQKGVAVTVLPSGHEAAPHPFLTALARIGRSGPA